MDHIKTEEQIIGILINDKEAYSVFDTSDVDIDHFDKRHKDILSALNFANVNNVSLTRDSYKNFLTTYKKSTPAEISAQLSLYSRCSYQKAKFDDLPILLKKQRQAHIRHKTSLYFQEYNKDRDKLGDVGANRALVDKLQGLDAETQTKKSIFVTAGEVKEDFMRKLLERRNNPKSRTICHIKEFDDTMNVGFNDGHLTIFCAPVAGGKTTTMVNIAANLVDHSNQSVMYLPLEMSHDEIVTKLVARETRISLGDIEHSHNLSDEDIKRIDASFDKWTNMENKFSILDLSERAKISLVRREIEQRISFFKPKVIFIDYSENLVPEIRRSRSDEEMNDMLQDLRKMGKSLGFHVCTAAQVSKDYIQKFKETKEGKQQSADTTSIRGGLVYGMNSDSVFAQMPDPMAPNEKLILMCIKSRHGSPTFGPQKNIKTTLHFQPEYALIESLNEATLDNMGASKESDELIDVVGKGMPSQDEVDKLIEEGSPF